MRKRVCGRLLNDSPLQMKNNLNCEMQHSFGSADFREAFADCCDQRTPQLRGR